MEEKFRQLSNYSITIIRWDKNGDWRLGLNWEDNDHEFIVEKPTVEECLDEAIKYVNNELE